MFLPDDDNDVGRGWGTNILIRVAKADIVACYFLMDNDVGQGWGTNILIRVAKADILVKETTARQKQEEKKFGECV